MKKLLAILLGSAMFAAAFAGLAACKPDEEEPNIKVPEITRRADTRAADAYAAYDNAGTKVGDYKTIADAINAVVEADLDFMEDDATPAAADGGYVTKKGGTRRLFQNKKGFADGNADQFWYYENGTMLEGYNCWDNTTGITTLHNTKVITHKVNSGNTSRQSWNGYGLLDENGQEINNGTLAQSWELSSTMDAGVMMFPKRKVGAAGLKYKIDLSEVKITPTYDGVKDPVYAFIGFYLWQDYYVIATGIACDTSTGQWYEFRGTSRDNSFSDVEYKMGECFMESTWNEGGYFTPNSSELEMQIQTKRMIDDTDGETYWVDDMTIAAKDGKTLNHQFDDEIVNQYFPGNSLAADNGFVFIAGLDVKNEIANGADVKNVDFFNGAKFENLCVTEAAIYFPTEEEMTDVEYSIGTIKPELRGKWNDALLANSVSSDGAYDYTILNNYACSSYTAKNGADYYDFKFDASPVAESELGGKLKTYQDTIDSLKNMTVDNVAQYTGEEGAYTVVGKMYGTDAAHTGSTLTQQYLLLLDFAPYVEAQKVYEAAMKLSDEAKAVREGFDALGNLANYTYKGWTTEETDVAGYIWSEAQKFNEINVEFKKLSEDEQGKVISLIAFGESGYDAWDEFYTSVNTYLTDTTATGKSYTIAQFDMPTPAKTVTYDGTQALQALFKIAYEINSGEFDPSDTAKKGTFNSDNTGNYQRAFHILFLMQKMREENVTIPDGFLNNIYEQLTSTDRATAFADDFNDYIYPVLTLAGQIYQRQQRGEFVWLDAAMAKVINDHMVGFEKFSEAGFNWNVTNTQDFRDGNTFYEQYFGLPDATTKHSNGNTIGYLAGNLKYIFDVVAACDPAAEKNETGLGFVADVTPLDEDPSQNGSETAKAFVSKITAFTALEGYEYKGWTTEEETKTGYLYSELTAFRALVAEREALEATDGAYVSAQIEGNSVLKAKYSEWEKLSAEMTALEENAVWETKFNTFAMAKGSDKKEYTAEESLAELIHVAYMIKTVGKTENSDPANYADDETTHTLDLDHNFNSTGRLCAFYDFFVRAGVTLPTYAQGLLTDVGMPTFYEEFFYPLSKMIRLASRISNESVTKLEDLTEDELAFLNKYWVPTYEMKGNLATHWYVTNENRGYFGWIAWKMEAQFTQILGGTIADKYNPGDYAQVLNTLLTANYYTLNAETHNWGVEDAKIYGVSLSETGLTVAKAFDMIGDLTAYKALGWEAPETAEGPKGYLLSEARYYTGFSALLEGLEEDDEEKIASIFGSANMEAWAELAPQILELATDEKFTAFKVTGAKRDRSITQEFTAGEALGEILTALGEVGSAKIDSDNTWFPSLRIYFFVIEFEEAGIELPEYLTKAIAAKENAGLDAGLNSADLKTDVKYLRTVLKIAKMLIDDPDLEITQDIIDMVNDTMVGKTRFTENGLNWNYTNDPKHDLFYRGSDYKVYYGLEASHTFKDLLESVIKFLVANGATATDTGYGVTAEMTLPTA